MRHITAKATGNEKAREVFRKATPEAFRTLIGLMTSRDPAVAKMATQRIVEHVLHGSLPVDLDRLSVEQRRQLRELLEKVTVRRRSSIDLGLRRAKKHGPSGPMLSDWV